MSSTRNVVLLGCIALAACTKPEISEPSAEPSPTAPRFVQRPGRVNSVVVARLPPQWRLPQGATGTTPLLEGLGLALQRDGLFLGNERLVAADGERLDPSAIEDHLIAALDERLETLAPALAQEAENRGASWSAHANLYLDPDMRVGDLIHLLFTLGRHDFVHYGLAVGPTIDDGADGQLVDFGVLVWAPKHALDESRSKVSKSTPLKVSLATEGLVVECLADDGKLEVTLLPWDSEALPALERIAKAHAEATSSEPQVRFVSDPELPVARLIEVMNAAAGSDCTTADVLHMKGGDPQRCHFVLRIFDADPRDRPPTFEEPEVWGGLTG